MHSTQWLSLTAILLFSTPAAAEDFSTVPPTTDEANQRASAYKVSLPQAIDIAQKSAGGIATSATLDLSGKTSEIKVVVYGKEKATEVVIDGASGSVLRSGEVSGLPGEPTKGKVQTTESGLQYYDLVVGTGKQPAGPSTKVKVHYSGYLVTGKKFDSSRDRGKPIDFRLSGVISGWTEGVGSMKVGGKRKLIIPYKLAYGASGRPPLIPKMATLIFDVELIDIVE